MIGSAHPVLPGTGSTQDLLAREDADLDAIVIGAGAAGLGAASALRAAGLRTVVLEASSRIGGRAWTRRPERLGGEIFDQGALWLHEADRNPLVPIARSAGEELVDFDTIHQRRT